MSRISPVTGKPVRKYRKRKTTKEKISAAPKSTTRAKLEFITTIAKDGKLTPAKKVSLITSALDF